MKMHVTKYFKDFGLQEWLWMLIWFCLPIGIKVSSLSLILGALVFLTSFIIKPHRIELSALRWALAPVLLFVSYALNGFSELPSDYIKFLEKLFPLIVIPLLYGLTKTTKEGFIQASFIGLTLALLIMGMVMLSDSLIAYAHTKKWDAFTYHDLARPFSLGAIYYSHLLLVALLMIKRVALFANHKKLGFSISAFFLILLFLSASKTMLLVGIPLLIYQNRGDLHYVYRKWRFSFLSAIVVILVLVIPLKNRIQPIIASDFSVVTQEQYRYDTPFNGLTLRLVQWRFGFEILKEQNAWLFGVGMTESTALLNEKYVHYGLYTGTEGTDDHGFLNYNYHNQYIESFLRAGLIGFLILLFIMVRYIMLFKTNQMISSLVLITYFAFFLSESVLERQIGIVLFCFIYFSVLLPERRTTN